MNILNKLTLLQLKENKQRTFLTGFSIALIVALLTAIAIFISSAWQFAYQSSTQQFGEWHFRTALMRKEKVDLLSQSKIIDSIVSLPSGEVSIAQFPEQKSYDKVNVLAVSENERLVRNLGYFYHGRLPKNENEIAIPYSLISQIDRTQNLMDQEMTLQQNGVVKSYKIAGIYSDAHGQAPYVFVKESPFAADYYTVFGKSNFLNRSYYDEMKKLEKSIGFNIFKHNNSLLSLYLITNNELIDAMMKMIIPTILIIILLISVTVIGSSFNLSLNERIKQLGALSSVGTTKGQLVTMMLFESFWIGIFSIIAGLIIGFIGTAISLYFFDQLAQKLISLSGQSAHFEFVVYWPVIVGVILFSLLIIVLSSILPSLRAARRSPIDNIKQVPFTKLLKFKSKKASSRRTLLSKVFGYPAYLAHRYQKHNSSRSWLIFFVLTISLISFNVISILLLGATGTIDQMGNNGFKNNLYSQSHIIVHDYRQKQDNFVLDQLKTIDGVENYYSIYQSDMRVNTGNLQPLIKEMHSAVDLSEYSISMIVPDDNKLNDLLKVANMTMSEFENKGILVYDDVFNGKKHIQFDVNSVVNTTVNVSKEVVTSNMNLQIATAIHADKLTFDLTEPLMIVVSPKMFEQINQLSKFQDMMQRQLVSITTDTTKTANVSKKLTEVIQDENLNNMYVYDVFQQREVMFAVLGMMQIVVFGFLGLISLICLTAFFNTITANTRLRRREFAMLQSVGMTNNQIRKMLSVENLKTGFYALITAIVISVIIVLQASSTVYNEDPMSGERNAGLLINWQPIMISSLVFIVILILFNVLAQRSVVKRSIVQDIKNETL